MALRIALVGPDGTGKTTIARHLAAEMPGPAKYIYMGINHDASNVMLPTTWLVRKLRRALGKSAPMGGPPPLNVPRKRGWRGLLSSFKSVARMANLIGEEWFRHLICWFAQCRGKTVVMDRHFFLDYYAHDVQPRYGSRHLASRLHGWMLRRLYPRPHFVIFLDGDAKVLYARKQEGTVEQLQRRREEYLAARPLFPDSVIIDATQPLSVVVRQAMAAIHDFRSAGQHRSGGSTKNKDTSPPVSIRAQAVTSSPVARMHTRLHDRKPSIPAVIVGLDCYTGLQTARRLHQYGIPVVGVAENRRHFACRSRACREIVTSPTRSLDLIRNLEQLGARLGNRPVLIPCIDMAVLLIAQYRERLDEWFRIALPHATCVETLLDKSSFYAFAEDHGFSVPRFANVSSREEAIAAAEHLNFPCIVKPAVKTDLWERTVKTKVFEARTLDELLRVVERGLAGAPILTVQEWIEGGDEDLHTCNGYFGQDSQPLVTFTSQKLRQWPPHLGVACLGRECPNEHVEQATVQLFQAARFHGLAYLEMKRDRRTGNYVCIEANVGRPTGRSAMAEVAGVELLRTMYCDLLGDPLPAARQQKGTSTKWIYFRRDVRAAWYYWRRGELTMRQYFHSIRGKKAYAVFSWRDPLPALFDLFSAAGKKKAAAASRLPEPTAPTELARSSTGQP